ncbi:54S ribosomal protein yml6, mitochondrial [Dispira simplex]|nr:54S ribosomal protein yml6, mitochondrial [Dispira simplex]
MSGLLSHTGRSLFRANTSLSFVRTLATLNTPSTPLPPRGPVSNARLIKTDFPTYVDPYQTTVQAWVRDFETNKPLSIVDLSAAVFNAPLRQDLIHQAVKYERNAVRQGTHYTRGISDVRGTTKKAFPQKGRGAARVGTLRAPQFRGGGVVHGPKPRSHATELPRKMWLAALRSALSAKYAQNQLVVVDNLHLDTLKTQHLYARLISHSWLFASKKVTSRSTYTERLQSLQQKAQTSAQSRFHATTFVPALVPSASVLFLAGSPSDNLEKALGNITNVDYMLAQDTEIYPLMQNELLVLDREAVELLQNKLSFK